MNGPIQTEYKGCLFRSRLEARWAVFLDALGVEWKYEFEGYEVDGHRYLPDFWLPASHTWVEVKGDPNGLRAEFARMCAVLGPKTSLPGFADGTSRLLLLGDVPDATDRTILHPCLVRRDGIVLQRTWGYFAPQKSGGAVLLADKQPSWLYFLFGKQAFMDPEAGPESEAWTVESWALRTEGGFRDIQDAYRAARQARFEHGETRR